MHSEYLLEDNEDSTKLSSRGASVYYLGSTLFVVGILLIILGSILIIFFQIRYGSEPEKILYTISSVATGIILVLIGINLMIKQMKKGYIIIIGSALFSSIAIFLMCINYFNNFRYPLISYIFVLYVIGFLALLANAFASVIVWIIGKGSDYQIKQEEKSRLYTDEEIQRDIDEATKKSIKIAVDELQFEIEEPTSDILIGKSASRIPGNIIRVKDNISEVLSLKKTLTPCETEKWGSVGIEKVSNQLAKTITHEKKKKSKFSKINEWLFKKIKSRWNTLKKLTKLKKS
jgi:hypothetical protein